MKLKDNVAIVTGAGGAIGRAIALRLASESAAVVVNDLHADNAVRVAAEITAAGFAALPFAADVTKSAEIREMTRAALDRFGRIDILVNNAGGSANLLKKLSHFKDTTEDIWKWVLNLNLNGTLICIHAVLPHMVEHRRGKIINIASIAAEVGILNRVDYSAAKGAVVSLTKALAMEVGPHDINVNCISPGMIASQPSASQPSASQPSASQPSASQPSASQAAGTWLGRTGKPEDIAALTAFLASDEANFITGANYTVDGGRVLGPKNA